MTSVPFDIPINNDIILEVDEDFTLTIVLSTLPNGVTRGSIGQVTVTIVDDDGEKFYIKIIMLPKRLMPYGNQGNLICFLSLCTENQMWT